MFKTNHVLMDDTLTHTVNTDNLWINSFPIELDAKQILSPVKDQFFKAHQKN